MSPHHVEVYVGGGVPYRGVFSIRNDEVLVSVELPNGKSHYGGAWPSLSGADSSAKMIVASMAGSTIADDESIQAHASRGGVLMVSYDNRDKKFAIVAGYAKKILDTGRRFDTEEEARNALPTKPLA